MSIKKLNQRATKGTKRWRKNIDITGLMDELEAQKQQEKLEREVKEKLKEKPLFFIDQTPTTSRRRREPLDPDRFKRKSVELSETETKQISKLAKKILRKEEEKKNRLGLVDHSEDEVNVNWDEDTADETVKTITSTKEVRVPAVLPPHEGQSYNPTSKAHKELLELVIKEEVEKDRIKNEVPEYEKVRRSDLIVKGPLPSKKERAEAREKSKRRLEKKTEHDFMYLKKIKKDVDNEAQELHDKLAERKKQQDEEDALIEQGKLVKTKMLNRNKYIHQGTDFHLAKDLKSNIRNVKVSGSLIKDRFESVFRRNLIEKTTYGKKKKKKSRIPNVKYHSTDRGRNDDTEGMKVFK